MTTDITHVIKRNGQVEAISFDKIKTRIDVLINIEPKLCCNSATITQSVISSMKDRMNTSQLDSLAADASAGMAAKKHPDYLELAGRIEVSNLHKETSGSFLAVVNRLYSNQKYEKEAPLISKELHEIVQAHHEVIQKEIDYSWDYTYDYFAVRTLMKAYLVTIEKEPIERPQDMLMRVSLGIHGSDFVNTFATYHLMKEKFFTHATPTLFNAGTNRPQMSSCFLLAMEDDSIEGIYSTLADCAVISKNAGGIGIHCHNIRASGSYIRGTNGVSNGLVPMLKVFNETARYVDQGGGKRKGSFAIYLEPWHADFPEFLELGKNHGAEELRARDMFYAVWMCDLFMKRMQEKKPWSLFCPSKAPGLFDCYGEEFEVLYEKYEREELYERQVDAEKLWKDILVLQLEVGKIFVLSKDESNKKSNQKNIGVVKSSNLCTEIIQVSTPEETAVCNLASISLPAFVKDGVYDHEALRKVTHQVTFNLNRIIDRNFYPTPKTSKSNLANRPIGIGVQGLANVFISMGLPYESKTALKLNNEIFETIYFAAMEKSCDMAKEEGHYETYPGSPISQGQFQFDLWKVIPSNRWDWDGLREKIGKYGVRNSLVTALMPTASTAQILGNNEAFEPFVSNMYVRQTLSGPFPYVNKQLIKDLIKVEKWNEASYNQILKDEGSVANLDISDEMKSLYKTAWEMRMKAVIDLAAGRGPYIDQSQSMNVWVPIHKQEKDDPVSVKDVNVLHSIHMYARKSGLKTWTYYVHTKPVGSAVKFSVTNEIVGAICRMEEGCLTCSS